MCSSNLHTHGLFAKHGQRGESGLVTLLREHLELCDVALQKGPGHQDHEAACRGQCAADDQARCQTGVGAVGGSFGQKQQWDAQTGRRELRQGSEFDELKERSARALVDHDGRGCAARLGGGRCVAGTTPVLTVPLHREGGARQGRGCGEEPK